MTPKTLEYEGRAYDDFEEIMLPYGEYDIEEIHEPDPSVGIFGGGVSVWFGDRCVSITDRDYDDFLDKHVR